MRRHELTANLILHLPLIVLLGMVVVAAHPVNMVVLFVLYISGLADLVYSKLPLFRHRVFCSFGPAHIPSKQRDAYFRGYKRLALGAAFNLLMLVNYSVAATGL
jgi:hypothetical protein